jgi:hypothetical protein
VLAEVPDRVTYVWTDLDALVGGRPRSAYEYAAFWSGKRSQWPGFRAIDVRIGDSVTFVRAGAHPAPRPAAADGRADTRAQAADVVLIGCAKQKLAHAAPARELYTSQLFSKERAYAEAANVVWFILPAKHGLVSPVTVLEPYALNLSMMSSDYRHAWGVRVVEQLAAAMGTLHTKTDRSPGRCHVRQRDTVAPSRSRAPP